MTIEHQCPQCVRLKAELKVCRDLRIIDDRDRQRLLAERDAALAASRHETDLCQQAIEDMENRTRLLTWAYSKLAYRSFANMDDCLAMDEIKLILMGAQ